MKAWDKTEELLRRSRQERLAEHEATFDALEAEGIDLHPDRSATHRHGDLEHASDHTHPHAHSSPGERPATGIIGAGPVGLALGVALTRAAWPVRAVASRDAGRRERFREHVPTIRAFAEAAALVDDVELIILAVPDDVITPLAATLRLYAGQAIVHTSGLLGPEALAPALAAGTQAGAFHPLVAFADLERSAGRPCASPRDRRRRTTRPPSSRRAGSMRCSTPSARLPPRSASTRRVRFESSCPWSSRRSQTPGRSAWRPRSPGRPRAGTRARLQRTLPRSRRPHRLPCRSIARS